MRYSEIVQPPKVGVRRTTAEAMVEHRGVFEELLKGGLRPVNPGAGVEIYDVDEVRAAWASYRDGLRAKTFTA